MRVYVKGAANVVKAAKLRGRCNYSTTSAIDGTNSDEFSDCYFNYTGVAEE